MALATSLSWGQATEPARAAYDRGVVAYDKLEFGDAATAFKQAHDQSPHEPSYLFALAQASRRIGEDDKDHQQAAHFAKAIEYFEKYLDLGTGTRRSDAEMWIRKMKGSTSKPPEAEGKSQVTLAIEPLAAPDETTTTYVDGEAFKQESVPLLTLGKHTFRVERAGFLTRELQVTCGASQYVKINLVSLPTRMVVTGRPEDVGAEIWVDGKHVDNLKKGSTIVTIEPGSSNVSFRKRGADPVQTFVQARRGDTQPLSIKLPRSTTRVVAYSTFATGAASMIFGAVSVGMALSAEADVQAYDRIRNPFQIEADVRDSHLDERDSWRNAAIAGFGVGLAAFGLGAALYWFDLPDPAPSPLRLDRRFTGRIKVVPAGNGLMIHGQF